MVLKCKLPCDTFKLNGCEDTIWAGWNPSKKLNSFLWYVPFISIRFVYKAFMIINQKFTLRPLCIGSMSKTLIKVDFITYVQHRALALDPNPSVSRWRHVNLKRSTAWCIKETRTLYLLYIFYVRFPMKSSLMPLKQPFRRSLYATT